MTAVKLSGICKRYPNGHEAVKSLDLEVASGELVALVGPSGCGKSTTLRMIAGLEEISEGELLIDGRRANELAPKDRGIGMVFQSYALYPHMTARENITFGLKLQKLPEDEISDRVHRVARQLKIDELLDRKPKQMSGGQRQRVAMARAVARRPDIFLFDEPLSNLDAQLRAEMRIEINQLHRSQGTTSFYVTHDQVEAMTLADRVVLLKKGELQQVGPPMELYDHPANRFVAMFIGSPTMNMISAQLTDKGLTFYGIDLTLTEERYAQLVEHGLVKGDGVYLGIRPHQLVAQVGVASALLQEDELRTTIEVIEPLGNETLCYVRPLIETQTDERSEHKAPLIVVRVESHVSIQSGDQLCLSFPAEALHLFHSDEAGRRL